MGGHSHPVGLGTVVGCSWTCLKVRLPVACLLAVYLAHYVENASFLPYRHLQSFEYSYILLCITKFHSTKAAKQNNINNLRTLTIHTIHDWRHTFWTHRHWAIGTADWKLKKIFFFNLNHYVNVECFVHFIVNKSGQKDNLYQTHPWSHRTHSWFHSHVHICVP